MKIYEVWHEEIAEYAGDGLYRTYAANDSFWKTRDLAEYERERLDTLIQIEHYVSEREALDEKYKKAFL